MKFLFSAATGRLLARELSALGAQVANERGPPRQNGGRGVPPLTVCVGQKGYRSGWKCCRALRCAWTPHPIHMTEASGNIRAQRALRPGVLMQATAAQGPTPTAGLTLLCPTRQPPRAVCRLT